MFMDPKSWLSSATGHRITDQDIANALGVTRKTANTRLNSGFSADDLIATARALGVNPAAALVDLDYITLAEVHELVESDGTLLTTADDADIVSELAERLVPPRRLVQLGTDAADRIARQSVDELARRRAPAPPAFDAGAGDVGSLPMVADSSPDHPEEDCEDYP